MKKNSILLLVLVSFFSFLKADIVNQETAAKVAKNHFSVYAPSLDYNRISLELAFTKTADNSAVYYIFNVEGNNGFIIVSAEDAAYPILGYSFEGSYTDQPGFEATNFNYWMNNYYDQIVFVRNNSLKADELISTAWNNLLESNPTPKEIEDVRMQLPSNNEVAAFVVLTKVF